NKYTRISLRKGSAGKLCTIRRDSRRDGRGVVEGEPLLIRAVRLHRPDLLVAAARAVGNEVDVAAERRHAAELGDDIRREFVRHLPRARLADLAEVALADQLGAGDVGLLDVEQPPGEHELATLRGGVSEGQVLG